MRLYSRAGLLAACALTTAVATTTVVVLCGRDDRAVRSATVTAPAPATAPVIADGANRVTLSGGGGSVVTLDPDANLVRRLAPDGRAVWSVTLDGYVGGVRPPHLAADAERVYVTHADGVTALRAATGAVVWHSPGPADGMLVSGDLLLAAQCGVSDDPAKAGRWLVARRAADGAEAFRVPLPAGPFSDPGPVREVAGLFLAQGFHSTGSIPDFAQLVDRAGRVHRSFDHEVVEAVWWGADRIVLTCRQVVRIAPDGSDRWTFPFGQDEFVPGGQLIPLPNGDLLATLYGRIANSGVRVVRLDPKTGRAVWDTYCDGLPGVIHSKYGHDATAALGGDGNVTVTSVGSAGTAVETFDGRTGASVARTVTMSAGWATALSPSQPTDSWRSWAWGAAGVSTVAGVAYAAVRRRRRRRSDRRRRGACVACGYDLRATPERCPECGAESAATMQIN